MGISSWWMVRRGLLVSLSHCCRLRFAMVVLKNKQGCSWHADTCACGSSSFCSPSNNQVGSISDCCKRGSIVTHFWLFFFLSRRSFLFQVVSSCSCCRKHVGGDFRWGRLARIGTWSFSDYGRRGSGKCTKASWTFKNNGPREHCKLKANPCDRTERTWKIRHSSNCAWAGHPRKVCQTDCVWFSKRHVSIFVFIAVCFFLFRVATLQVRAEDRGNQEPTNACSWSYLVDAQGVGVWETQLGRLPAGVKGGVGWHPA